MAGVLFSDGTVLVVVAEEGPFQGSDYTPADPPSVALWVGTPEAQ